MLCDGLMCSVVCWCCCGRPRATLDVKFDPECAVKRKNNVCVGYQKQRTLRDWTRLLTGVGSCSDVLCEGVVAIEAKWRVAKGGKRGIITRRRRRRVNVAAFATATSSAAPKGFD